MYFAFKAAQLEFASMQHKFMWPRNSNIFGRTELPIRGGQTLEDMIRKARMDQIKYVADKVACEIDWDDLTVVLVRSFKVQEDDFGSKNDDGHGVVNELLNASFLQKHEAENKKDLSIDEMHAVMNNINQRARSRAPSKRVKKGSQLKKAIHRPTLV